MCGKLCGKNFNKEVTSEEKFIFHDDNSHVLIIDNLTNKFKIAGGKIAGQKI